MSRKGKKKKEGLVRVPTIDEDSNEFNSSVAYSVSVRNARVKHVETGKLIRIESANEIIELSEQSSRHLNSLVNSLIVKSGAYSP
jgi:hypothetical protein